MMESRKVRALASMKSENSLEPAANEESNSFLSPLKLSLGQVFVWPPFKRVNQICSASQICSTVLRREGKLLFTSVSKRFSSTPVKISATLPLAQALYCKCFCMVYIG